MKRTCENSAEEEKTGEKRMKSESDVNIEYFNQAESVIFFSVKPLLIIYENEVVVNDLTQELAGEVSPQLYINISQSSGSKIFRSCLKLGTMNGPMDAFVILHSRAMTQFDLDLVLRCLMNRVNGLKNRKVLLDSSTYSNQCLAVFDKAISTEAEIENRLKMGEDEDTFSASECEMFLQDIRQIMAGEKVSCCENWSQEITDFYRESVEDVVKKAARCREEDEFDDFVKTLMCQNDVSLQVMHKIDLALFSLRLENLPKEMIRKSLQEIYEEFFPNMPKLRIKSPSVLIKEESDMNANESSMTANWDIKYLPKPDLFLLRGNATETTFPVTVRLADNSCSVNCENNNCSHVQRVKFALACRTVKDVPQKYLVKMEDVKNEIL